MKEARVYTVWFHLSEVLEQVKKKNLWWEKVRIVVAPKGQKEFTDNGHEPTFWNDSSLLYHDGIWGCTDVRMSTQDLYISLYVNFPMRKKIVNKY